MITIERFRHRGCSVFAAICVCLFTLQTHGFAQSNPNLMLVKVNGKAVTQGDLDFYFLSRGFDQNRQKANRHAILERLIDRQLMKAFLKLRKAKVNKREVDLRIGRVHKLIKKQGDEPEAILAKLGMTPKRLKSEIELPLAWNIHFLRMVPEESIREYFKKHRGYFDGTEVRASQILLKISRGANKQHRKNIAEKLNKIRSEISAGKVTFEQAAKKHSQAASRDDGGDMGFFPYRGKESRVIANVAFSLRVGEISHPFETPFGMHILKVTKIKEGELSLEDARQQVLKQLSNEKWNEVVKDLRSKAKIEWLNR